MVPSSRVLTSSAALLMTVDSMCLESGTVNRLQVQLQRQGSECIREHEETLEKTSLCVEIIYSRQT